MSIGSGLAVAAIWAAVGAIGWQNPGAGVLASCLAAIATIIVAGGSQ